MDATLTFEDIGPQLAQKYLGMNIDHNRSPMNDRIVRMARDMTNGDWVSTADPIKFNRDGRLIDGQHRLRAIMMSKTTQRFLVARDLVEDAVYVIDTGATRSASQAMKIAAPDSKNVSSIVAAAQIVRAWDSGHLKNANSIVPSRERMTNAELLAYVSGHQAEFDRAARMSKNFNRSLPLPPSAVAAAAVILARVDPEQASIFFEAIRNGTSGIASGDPIATLVRRVFNDRLERRQVNPGMALFYLFRTWNAWRADQTLSRILTGTPDGPALIPAPR